MQILGFVGETLTRGYSDNPRVAPNDFASSGTRVSEGSPLCQNSEIGRRMSEGASFWRNSDRTFLTELREGPFCRNSESDRNCETPLAHSNTRLLLSSAALKFLPPCGDDERGPIRWDYPNRGSVAFCSLGSVHYAQYFYSRVPLVHPFYYDFHAVFLGPYALECVKVGSP